MRYETPASAKEAAGLLKKEKGAAFLLAGGTDLLVKLKMGIVEPDLVVDIKRIPKISEIQSSTKGFTIGAAVSGAELGEHAGLKKAWPGVVEAANLIGSDQIQGRATLPGNLCNASPAADSVPALIAAGAKAVVVGPLKKRTVAVEKIVIGPGKTSLAKGELIEAITLPKAEPRSGDAYLRFTPRTEMDIAVAGAAVSVTLDADGTCTAARVSIGAVATTALLVTEAADALIGTKLEDAALNAAAAAATAASKPITDRRGTIEFRRHVVGVLTRRAAVIAAQRAKEK